MTYRSTTVLAVLMAVAAVIASAGFRSGGVDQTPSIQFATWNGLGPDKWASIWLADRYLNPGVRVHLVPENTYPEGYTLIDTPGSQYLRDTERSTFAKLLQSFRLNHSALSRLEQVVQDIEVNMWLPDKDRVSLLVEQAFRALQESYGRTRVPYSCYMQFFDNVEAFLSKQSSIIDSSNTKNSLLPTEDCGSAGVLARDEGEPVRELPIAELLDLVRSGKKVAFVDVREPQEFEENHIPGAINLQIRDLSEDTVDQLRGADIVVSYCVKDFRGFEMAKKLHGYGINNTVILTPYGLKGWIHTGMPVFKQGQISEQSAQQAFQACVDRNANCKAII